MYLVTLYFDDKTNKILERYIRLLSEKTGNDFMIAHEVPPHLTISQIESRDENILFSAMDRLQKNLSEGVVDFVSVGMFLPSVLYAAPVYNASLDMIVKQVFEAFESIPDIRISQRYQPMSFVPHVTLGKTLSKEQMQEAVKVMQEYFVPFRGETVEVGLSKVNPFCDLVRFGLESESNV